MPDVVSSSDRLSTEAKVLTPVSFSFEDPQTRVKDYQVLEDVGTREDTIVSSVP